MKQNNIKIDNVMLFTLNPKLNSNYALWIYLYLRFQNKITEEDSEYSFYVDAKEIAEFFNINKATVYEALNLLKHIKLIERHEKSYYFIKSETYTADLIREIYEGTDEISKVPEFIIIDKQFFDKFFESGGKPIELIIYYYLALHKSDLDINITQKQVCDKLLIDHRTYKRSIKALENYSLLEKDGNKLLLTKFETEDFGPEPTIHCEQDESEIRVLTNMEKCYE